ncbi:hypothetical protein [Streptomyces sp. Je 1-332]|uniref:hypothetical protein n=1 Tax=Streptomyces sp. Je 1-332 TaxID=3231270 RepID=UPI00345A520D
MGQFDVEIEVPEVVAEWTAVPSGVASLSAVGAEPGFLISDEVVRFGDGEDSVVEQVEEIGEGLRFNGDRSVSA